MNNMIVSIHTDDIRDLRERERERESINTLCAVLNTLSHELKDEHLLVCSQSIGSVMDVCVQSSKCVAA